MTTTTTTTFSFADSDERFTIDLPGVVGTWSDRPVRRTYATRIVESIIYEDTVATALSYYKGVDPQGWLIERMVDIGDVYTGHVGNGKVTHLVDGIDVVDPGNVDGRYTMSLCGKAINVDVRLCRYDGDVDCDKCRDHVGHHTDREAVNELVTAAFNQYASDRSDATKARTIMETLLRWANVDAAGWVTVDISKSASLMGVYAADAIKEGVYVGVRAEHARQVLLRASLRDDLTLATALDETILDLAMDVCETVAYDNESSGSTLSRTIAFVTTWAKAQTARSLRDVARYGTSYDTSNR